MKHEHNKTGTRDRFGRSGRVVSKWEKLSTRAWDELQME